VSNSSWAVDLTSVQQIQRFGAIVRWRVLYTNNSRRKNVDMIRWLVLRLGLSPDGRNGYLGAASRNSSPLKVALNSGGPEIVNLPF